MTVTQAIGTAFRSQPRPGQWNPYRGPVPPPRSVPTEKQKRQAIIAIPAPPPPPVERTWFNDRRLQSRWVLVKDEGGKDFGTLYTIGALAEALGKSAVTIRRWLRTGVLPETKLKTGPIEGTPGNAPRRLWTRAQIETILAIGREEGVLGPGGPREMSGSKFPERVRAAWLQNEW